MLSLFLSTLHRVIFMGGQAGQGKTANIVLSHEGPTRIHRNPNLDSWRQHSPARKEIEGGYVKRSAHRETETSSRPRGDARDRDLVS